MSYQDDPRDLNGPDETFDSTPTTEQSDERAGYAAYDAYDAARALRLDEHIEQLRAERRPKLRDGASVEDAQLHGLAALLHAAAPGAADPDPTFAASLLAHLEREAASLSAPAADPEPAHEESSLPTPVPTPMPTPIPFPVAAQSEAGATGPQRAIRIGRANTRSGVSRRGLLAGGLGAAAAAVVGAATGALYEQQAMVRRETNNTPLVLKGHGVWEPVAAVEEIPLGAVRHFQTAAIVGFIRHTDQGFSALSGVCTHMSCFLTWNGGARTFDCPCHGGRFSEDGHAAPSSPIAYRPLPSIETKVEQGQVWVYVIPPAATASGATPTPDGTPTDTPTGYIR